MIKIDLRSRKQLQSWSCGEASLRTLFHHYGVEVSERELIDEGDITEEGTDFSTMRKLAREYGFSFFAKTNGSVEILEKYLKKKIPVLVCYQLGTPNGHNGHYSVISGIDSKYITISDPSNFVEGDGEKFTKNRKMEIDNFLKHWWETENSKVIRKWYAIVKLRRKK